MAAFCHSILNHIYMSASSSNFPSGPLVNIAPDRATMGHRAAVHVVQVLQTTLARQATARVMFACAPSQNEFLAELATLSAGVIDWSHITAFHMDEYAVLPATHPASFRHYLSHHFLTRLPRPPTFEPIAGEAPDPAAECARYARLLDTAPFDLICLGIGENGHIAFNDPPVVDFADVQSVKLVQLDQACRQQQVNDGCFANLATVPSRALTVTIPVFLRAHRLSIVAPGLRKAAAVRATLRDPISTACPATILRTHEQALLFLDRDSAAELGESDPFR